MHHDERLTDLILARALTLDERLSRRPAPRGTMDRESLTAALAPWVKAYSPGDPAALLRRLGWDGITPEAAAGLFDEAGVDASERHSDDGLAVDIAAIVEAASRKAQRSAVDIEKIPFAPVWSAFVDVALHRAEPAIRSSGLLSPDAIDELARHLAGQLSWWGSPTLLHRFDGERSSGHGSFETFCAGILARPLEFWADHAALLRRLLLIVKQWVDATVELAGRLDADRQSIHETLGVRVERVSRIRPGLSDRHHSGRQVAILEIQDGARVVYKPRECRSLSRFNDLLHWYETRGGDESPRPISVLDRGSYAWIEFVEHATLASRADVGRYYRKAGALLGLAWMSGGRDLHMDNIICSSEGPVIVDTEAFVPPRWSDDSDGHPGAMQLARNRVASSVVGTAMLSFPQQDARGRVYDIGGMCGEGGYLSPAPSPFWNKPNTDEMHLAEETRIVEPMQNVVRRERRVETPEDWVDEIVSGFHAAFATILASRDALVAPDGPLAAFADASCRIIFRPSNQYATLLQTMTSPACSRSGLTASLYVESLGRPFNRDQEKPELWALAREERESLANLDVPLFTVGCSATHVASRNGERIEGLIAASGVDALIERVRQLDRDALAEQTRLIRASLLSSSGHSDDETVREAPITGALPTDPARFIDEARRIGDAVLGAAIRGSDGAVTWIAPEYVKITSLADLGATYYLYSGVTGPALFLAALGKITGQVGFTSAARGSWSTLEKLVASGDAIPVRNHLRLGICNGIGSIIYAAVMASDLHADPTLLDVARGFGALIDEERLANETDFDVEGGIAGAVLALVRLHEATGERAWLELAARGADRLVEIARTDEHGAFWVPPESDVALAGMAHGAAGTAFALDAYASAAGRDDIRGLARDAFRWELSVFDPALGNWPARTSDGRRIDMVAWCHGAAGIGLTRVAAGSIGSTANDEDLERAIRAVAATGLHPVDHVCCGNSGRIDFLLEASLSERRPDLLDEARRRCATMIDRAALDRGYALTVEASEKDLLRPGFFRGLSGIGYTLLRAADPTAFPCITRFDRPGRISS